jgi:hypothetical protein
MTNGMHATKRSVSMTTDRSIEEPCEVTSLTHGFEAERRGRPLRLGSGLNIQCFPDEHAVERQIARQQNRRENEREGTEGLDGEGG